MRLRIKNNAVSVLAVLICVVGLVAVRVFENVLFFDPFLAFFKGDFNQKKLPVCDGFWLGLNYFFRYFLNTALSVGILFFIFKSVEVLRFSIAVYLILFVVLMVLFFAILAFNDASLNMILFYVRRFIIQPVLLLLFVPGFYYQKTITKKVQ
jgi:exosortase F-associated protein